MNKTIRQLVISGIAMFLLVNVLPAQQKMYIYQSGKIIGTYPTAEIDSIIFYASIPVITTEAVTDVTVNSAKCGGNVISNGGEEVTERGVCWNTSGNPVYTDSKTLNGTGTGTFEAAISGLSAGQTYYVRSYAKNSVGIAYGNQQVFSTPAAVAPVISSNVDYNVSTTGASITITVSSDGGSNITAKGVIWSASVASPDLNNKDGMTNEGGGSGTFTSTIGGLVPNKTYYVRAYATNSAGTSYGNVFTFTTTDSKFTDAEGNEYSTVTIGSQTWMGQNLKVTKYNNGDIISGSWDYNNNAQLRNTYGRLYTWNAATDNRKVCPTGWHVPSSDEWDELINYLANNGYADAGLLAKAMCSQTGWANSGVPNTPGYQQQNNNASGFSATASGMRASWGEYIYMDYATWWWTSDDWIENPQYGAYRTISNSMAGVTPYVEVKETGFSIRCIKDVGGGAEPTKTKPTVTTENSSNISTTGATINGKVTSDGGAVITQRGFYYSSTSSTPDQNSTVVLVVGQTGDFSKALTGLKENTTYYFRAFATNSVGTSTGDVKSFKTESSGGVGGETATTFTDARDGHVYKKVVIGTQTWMAENLAYLPVVHTPYDYEFGNSYYYVYGYNGTSVADAKATQNYKTYGVMYNWFSAMNGESASSSVPSGVRGVCPAGWHLPSYDEMYVMINYLGGDIIAGNALKVAGTEFWKAPNAGATNSSGFSALPGGSFWDGYGFTVLGEYGYWWCATEIDEHYGYDFELGYDLTDFWHYSAPKSVASNIRCVKDQ